MGGRERLGRESGRKKKGWRNETDKPAKIALGVRGCGKEAKRAGRPVFILGTLGTLKASHGGDAVAVWCLWWLWNGL